jgi:hypothetical protein
MKKFFFFAAMLMGLASCTDLTKDAKKVRVKSIRFDNYKAAYVTSVAVDEMIVDTIFNIGDTIEESHRLYVIVQ